MSGMKKLGFSIWLDREHELEFERGSGFADEPSSRMYVKIRFDPPNRRQVIVVLTVPYVIMTTVFDWVGWIGVNEYYNAVLPLVEQIAQGDPPSIRPFLDLCTHVGHNMILFWGMFCGLIIALTLMPWYVSVNFDWVAFVCGLVVSVFILSRIGIDICCLRELKAIRSKA